jgi:hypothetical protein
MLADFKVEDNHDRNIRMEVNPLCCACRLGGTRWLLKRQHFLPRSSSGWTPPWFTATQSGPGF